MRRVSIIGTSGSGKTTLATQLARRIGAEHVELDALHWGPNWTGKTPAEFTPVVEAATAGAAWCVCGNYNAVVTQIVWPRADTVIWLDYPMSITAYRVVKRTIRRWWRGETLWAGNRERLWTQLCMPDSLWLYVVKTWRRNRRQYPLKLSELRRQGKHIYRFRSPRQTAEWLAALDRTGAGASR